MDYNDCKILTDYYGGYPVSITSAIENNFISSKYPERKWIGIFRNNCTDDTDYKNEEGLLQEYFNWNKTEDSNFCKINKLKVAQDRFGNWLSQSGLEKNNCIIEVNSKDIYRPVKICAPWWRIERDYKLTEKTIFSGIDLAKINQADIPDQLVVCTKYNSEAVKNLTEKTVTHECVSYYQATKSDICLRDPIQDQCFVNECIGYVTNSCTKEAEISGYKDYTKTKALINGSMQWIKDKQMIKTHIYKCPASPSSSKDCLEKSSVIVFPKECPGSKCQELRECLSDASALKEPQRTNAVNNCRNNILCLKIYPQVERGGPNKFDWDGNLINLYGSCPDGSILEFPVNVQKKHSKKCLEYEFLEEKKQISQTCVLERDSN
jgi:hypothetical protein